MCATDVRWGGVWCGSELRESEWREVLLWGWCVVWVCGEVCVSVSVSVCGCVCGVVCGCVV